MATTTYLTVAIPYVNAAPHLGYAYELVLADIAARARRSRRGEAVRLLGGTDDFALKNALAAEAAGVPTADFVAANAARFAGLKEALGISFDDFIHTSSDPRHAPAVARLWRAVAASGDLYTATYKGEYCVGCEQFYVPDELVDGACPEHLRPTESVEEENWFFRLSTYQERLETLLASRQIRVEPEAFHQEALSFVRSGLADISVSRSAQRARGWGLPVPGDASQVIYVWFDALANYISALGYGTEAADYCSWWSGGSERVHVIGKGILRFHAVYWPAFLLSAGEALPTRIRVHPYITVEGQKLSKSSGHALDPEAVVSRFGVDALRWWFARQVQAGRDTDFSIEALVGTANADLAGGVGNVAARVLSLIRRFRAGAVPEPDQPGLAEVANCCALAREAFADLDPRRGTALILEAVGALNRDLERTAPWRLAQEPGQAIGVDYLLARYWASVVRIAEALGPVTPQLGDRLLGLLGSGAHPSGPIPAPFARLALD